MKKILFTAAILAVACDSHANVLKQCGSCDGFYFGFGAAVSDSRDKVERYYDGTTYWGLEGGYLNPENIKNSDLSADNRGADIDYAEVRWLKKSLDESAVDKDEGISGQKYKISSSNATEESALPLNADWYRANGSKGDFEGASFFTYFDTYDYGGEEYKSWLPELDKSKLGLGGTIVAGYLFDVKNKIKLGVEAGFDFIAGSKAESSGTNDIFDGAYTVSAKRKAARFMLNVVLGIPLEGGLMPYAKIGLTRHQTAEKYYRTEENSGQRKLMGTFNKSSMRPAFTLGLEKKMTDKLSVHYELEYRVGKDFDTSNVTSYTIESVESTGANKLSVHQKGTLTLRMLCVYRPGVSL